MCFGHKLSFFSFVKERHFYLKKKKSLNKVSKRKIPHDTYIHLGALRVSKNAIKFEHLSKILHSLWSLNAAFPAFRRKLPWVKTVILLHLFGLYDVIFVKCSSESSLI